MLRRTGLSPLVLKTIMLRRTGPSPLGSESYYVKTNGTIPPRFLKTIMLRRTGLSPKVLKTIMLRRTGLSPLGPENYYVKTNGTIPPRPGARKDLINILSQKNTKEELIFLKKLIRYDILQIGTSPFNILDSSKFTQSPFFGKLCSL